VVTNHFLTGGGPDRSAGRIGRGDKTKICQSQREKRKKTATANETDLRDLARQRVKQRRKKEPTTKSWVGVRMDPASIRTRHRGRGKNDGGKDDRGKKHSPGRNEMP